MERRHYIYILICPIENKVKYIGRTIKPEIRLKAHLTCSDGSPEKRNWIKKLKRKKLKPIMEIVDSTFGLDMDAENLESEIIEEYNNLGHVLINAKKNKANPNPRRGITKAYYDEVIEISKRLKVTPREYLAIQTLSNRINH